MDYASELNWRRKWLQERTKDPRCILSFFTLLESVWLAEVVRQYFVLHKAFNLNFPRHWSIHDPTIRRAIHDRLLNVYALIEYLRRQRLSHYPRIRCLHSRLNPKLIHACAGRVLNGCLQWESPVVPVLYFLLDGDFRNLGYHVQYAYCNHGQYVQHGHREQRNSCHHAKAIDYEWILASLLVQTIRRPKKLLVRRQDRCRWRWIRPRSRRLGRRI